MAITLDLVLLIAALICFIAAALNAKVSVNLTALGLSFVTLSLIF